MPLFQGLLVLATGKQVRAGVDERGARRSFSTVTVEVEPEHAQRLVVAQRAGKLTAVLRNPDDPQRMAARRWTSASCWSMGSPAAAAGTVAAGDRGRAGSRAGRIRTGEEGTRAAAGSAAGSGRQPRHGLLQARRMRSRR